MKSGLIVSIDFELNWGYRNSKKPLTEAQIQKTLDRLINLFNKYEIKSTWATVGQLFSNHQLENSDNGDMRFHWIKHNLIDNELVELGSHTFDHIFTEEVTAAQFSRDLESVKSIEKRLNLKFDSMVFPRNQYDEKSLNILIKYGYSHYRNVLDKWYFKTSKSESDSSVKKIIKKFVELLPLRRDVQVNSDGGFISVSDSRFFRFFKKSGLGILLHFYYLQLLKYEMRSCFKRKKLYHLWFHPHNLMTTPDGFEQLEEVLKFHKSIEQLDQDFRSWKINEISK